MKIFNDNRENEGQMARKRQFKIERKVPSKHCYLKMIVA